MKLILYTINIIPHHKNLDGIQRMCKSCNIDFEHSHDLNRIKQNDYDILYCISNYVDYTHIPKNIKIIYGPQLWVIPQPPIIGKLKNELVGHCVFNSLSEWVGNFFLEMATEFIMPINYFPFSVNTDKFKPDENIVEKEYDCIVYIKRRSTKLINNILDILKNMNIKYKIFKYGTYKEEEYKNILLQSKFMVVLDAHESQGFALEEAMSCNVPLLVIDATSMYDETNDGINSTYGYLKPKKLLATSVPYWSNECGIKITHESEFKSELDNMLKKYNTFTPREYILKTLSDKVCMKRILEYFKL